MLYYEKNCICNYFDFDFDMIGSIKGIRVITYDEIMSSLFISKFVEDDDWILIGEVTLSRYNNTGNTISISLEGDSPVYKSIKMHSYYYLEWLPNLRRN